MPTLCDMAPRTAGVLHGIGDACYSAGLSKDPLLVLGMLYSMFALAFQLPVFLFTGHLQHVKNNSGTRIWSGGYVVVRRETLLSSSFRLALVRYFYLGKTNGSYKSSISKVRYGRAIFYGKTMKITVYYC